MVFAFAHLLLRLPAPDLAGFRAKPHRQSKSSVVICAYSSHNKPHSHFGLQNEQIVNGVYTEGISSFRQSQLG